MGIKETNQALTIDFMVDLANRRRHLSNKHIPVQDHTCRPKAKRSWNLYHHKLGVIVYRGTELQHCTKDTERT